MEKKNYREMLLYLTERGCPTLMTRKYVAEFLGIAVSTLARIIRKGKIKLQGSMITIGELANYLCGG